MAPSQPELSIVAPCFNEEEGIAQVLKEWDKLAGGFGVAVELVICNDGSTDRSKEILEGLRKEMPRLVAVHNAVNSGYGHALSTAIKASRGRLVMTMDSDGQFDAGLYPKLRQAMEEAGADGVTGWRMGKKDTWLRVVADRVMNLMVRALFGVRLKDTNCAQKLVRGDLLRGLNLEAKGYPTPTEICVKLHHGGHKLAETGVAHYERQAGVSKLKFFRTGFNALRFFLYLRRKIVLYRAGVLNKL